MRYKLLGNSGLRVSELCLGTMAFGEEWGWGGSRQECGRVVDTFAQAGGNFIDTADNYTDGTAERYVGELIAPERDRWVLATKYTLSRDPADPNGAGNHRKSLVHALDASLKRLNTDYVDVLWVHIWTGGRRSWPSKRSTAWSSAPWSASSHPWPRRSIWRCSPGARSAWAC